LQDSRGRWHMWPAEMSHHCGINSWERNSAVVHATTAASNGLGLYEREGVLWSVFASEPTVALSPLGEAVMWWSMNPPNSSPPGGAECVSGCVDGATVPQCNSNYTRNQSFTTYVSWTLDDSWTTWSPPMIVLQGTPTSQDSNMAGTILPNGSVVGLWRTKQYGGLHRVTAGNYKDPTSYVWHEHDAVVAPSAAHPLAPEDPFVWSNSRGYHSLFHHRSCTAPWVNKTQPYATVDCGGLAYSANGVVWHYADLAGTAYTPVVQWDEASGGGSYRFARRERPHLLIDRGGHVVGLTNGVQYSWVGQARGGMNDATYTLLQPVRTVTS
jgi:hypothetical protein